MLIALEILIPHVPFAVIVKSLALKSDVPYAAICLTIGAFALLGKTATRREAFQFPIATMKIVCAVTAVIETSAALEMEPVYTVYIPAALLFTLPIYWTLNLSSRKLYQCFCSSCICELVNDI